MNITCGECGYTYSNSLSSCPECGNPTVIEPFVNTTGLSNCPNCGAPVSNNYACDYCESRFPKRVNVAQAAPSNNQAKVDTNESRNSGVKAGAAAAAFLGGLIGGILGD